MTGERVPVIIISVGGSVELGDFYTLQYRRKP